MRRNVLSTHFHKLKDRCNRKSRHWPIIAAMILLCCVQMSQGQDNYPQTWKIEPPPAVSVRKPGEMEGEVLPDRIEATAVTAFQKADVPTEVPGVIAAVNFREGDKIEAGSVVVQINERQLAYEVEKGEAKVRTLELSFELAESELSAQQEMFSLDASSLQELLKKKTEVNLAASRLNEAKADLKLSRLNLERCQIRAPFTGHLASLSKQPFEACRGLDTLFSIIDSSKVYIIANVPEELGPSFKEGGRVVFAPRTGVQHYGKVERVGKVIDPKSKTMKVYVLIENEKAELEVGMTGSLSLVKEK
jgi:RND family efflux transporter MFP subunit